MASVKIFFLIMKNMNLINVLSPNFVRHLLAWADMEGLGDFQYFIHIFWLK